MAKRASAFERKVARIRALRQDQPQSAAPELRELLGDREPYVVRAAADAVAELGLGACIGDVASALVRTVRGEQPDGGCMASAQLAEALLRLDADAPDAFRAGISYVRRERVGLAIVDVAVPVRIQCAMGLARSVARGALLDLAPMLADQEAPVRAGAARAVALLHGEGPVAVLHLKMLAGDPAPEVSGACMEGLIALDPVRFVPVVERALDDEMLGEVAALALGESRHPDALPALRRALESNQDVRRAGLLLLAAALLRLPEALELLFEYLARAPEPIALHALEALAVHRHDDSVVGRVRKAVEGRASAALRAAFQASFKPAR